MSPDLRRVDLHAHTSCSDGLLSPEELVRAAARLGLAALAVTDHDSVEGLAEAEAAAVDAGVELIRGVEISCEEEGFEIHILGYLLDDPESVRLPLQDLREHREERMRAMIEKTAALGFDVRYDEVAALADGGSIGRPHLARVLERKGYVRSIEEAFLRYLGDDGAANVPKKRLRVVEAVQCIRASGGIPVVAHPGVNRLDPILPSLFGQGVEGIEVYSSAHTAEDTARYRSLALAHGLCITGGSDFHGPESEGRILGEPRVPYETVTGLKARRAGKGS
ncbi:MAG: PHP domain-containing protein [Planctomycetota bacterium]